MRKQFLMWCAALVMCWTTLGVRAENTPDRQFPDEELIKILKDEGYGSVEKRKEGVITFKADGRTLMLFNKSRGSLQLAYGFSGAKISFESINEWNLSKRFSRAYLDSDKDPVLEADWLGTPDTTPGQVGEFVRVFVGSAGVFKAFILQRDGK